MYGEPLKGNRLSLLVLGEIDLLDVKAHFKCAKCVIHSHSCRNCTLFGRYDCLFTQISSLNGPCAWDNLLSWKWIIQQLFCRSKIRVSQYTHKQKRGINEDPTHLLQWKCSLILTLKEEPCCVSMYSMTINSLQSIIWIRFHPQSPQGCKTDHSY